MTHRSEIERVFRVGKVLRLGSLSARLSASSLPHVRVGIVVPHHGHNAVERNTLKRRLRELTRVELLALPGGVDVILVAGTGAYRSDFTSLQERVQLLRAHIEAAARPVAGGGP